MKLRGLARSAALRCAAALVGVTGLGCGALPPVLAPGGTRVHTAQPPSADERYCAWYGDARDGVLYFGQAAFWSAYRAAGGDPRADLAAQGPVRVGRFDLRRERWLAPLEVGRPGDRSGVWDVLAHANGRVYFTSFFEPAGWVDPDGGAVVRLPELGEGLNELAPGPEGSILVTRYADMGGGAVLALDAEGRLLAEHPLMAPDGYMAAPKTPAYDPLRREIWLTTDLLPVPDGVERPIRHDAYVLDAQGRELARVAEPEIQFAVFGDDGTGFFAEVEGPELWLRVTPPGAGRDAGRRLLLDDAFSPELDFVQDLKLAADGGALVSRWSGWVHGVDPAGEVSSARLPAADEDGLYYTAVQRGGRLCATYCADVNVVCAPSP